MGCDGVMNDSTKMTKQESITNACNRDVWLIQWINDSVVIWFGVTGLAMGGCYLYSTTQFTPKCR